MSSLLACLHVMRRMGIDVYDVASRMESGGPPFPDLVHEGVHGPQRMPFCVQMRARPCTCTLLHGRRRLGAPAFSVRMRGRLCQRGSDGEQPSARFWAELRGMRQAVKPV